MYSYFEDPDFVKKQNELKAMNEKLSGINKDFSEKNKPKSVNFGLDDFSTNYESKAPTLGRSKDYMNPLTTNNDESMAKGLDYMGLSNDSKGAPVGSVQSSNTGSFVSNNAGAIGGILGGIGDTISASAKNEYANEKYVDEKELKDEAREKSVGQIKDGVASAIGPFGTLFRGIEKVGNGIGDSIGGEGGAIVNSIFSPDEAIMANMSDKDVSTGDKILGTLVPIYAGISANRAKAKRKKEFMLKQFEVEGIKREQEQRMKYGKESIEKLTALRKAQLGYMI